MTEEKNTVDYTIRAIDRHVDMTINYVAQAEGKAKSVLLRDLILKVYTDRIKVFGMTSPLVAALDAALAAHLGAELGDTQADNFYGTKWNLELRDLLDIKSDEDLQQILMNNTPYITVRADQVYGPHGCNWIPKSQSLWFALFAALAFSPPDTVHMAWKRIFYKRSGDSKYEYYQHINQLRKLRHMLPVWADGMKVIHEGKYCKVILFNPGHYQYGAWHMTLTLNEQASVAVNQDTLKGLRFPRLPQRLLVASQEDGFSCAASAGAGEFEPGFRFVEGMCELDLYSNGISEDLNETPLSTVVTELANVVDERLRPLMA